MSAAEGTTALGVVNLTAGSDVGRLGEAAKVAEAALATGGTPDPAKVAADKKVADDAAAAASRDTSDAAAKAAADKKAADDAAAAKVSADALAAAEKAVADAKTPEEKAAAQTKLDDLKKAGEKKSEGAPEKYEDFKLPDGVKLDAVALETALPIFKDLNLNQEQAQKLVDLEASRVAARATADLDRWNTHMATTLSAAKSDKEVGGANWDQSIADAKVAVEKFGTPALQTYLNSADAGSHVEVIRLLSKLGKAVKEDGFVPGGGNPAAEPKSLAHRLFPNDK